MKSNKAIVLSKVTNSYKLTLKKIQKLYVNRDALTKIIADKEILKDIGFWRNDVIHAWCLSGDTAQSDKDREYGTFNEFWLGIYDLDAPAYKGAVRATCSAWGGMAHYKFNEFFLAKDIEHKDDLIIQEKLLQAVNTLIDKGVLMLSSEQIK